MRDKKRIILYILLFFICNIYTNQIYALSSDKTKASFKVWGNCGMCHDKITDAAESIDGVIYLKWNSKTNIAKVKYYSKKTSLQEIQKKIALSGYDTEDFKSDDETYNNLHYCCRYDRE